MGTGTGSAGTSASGSRARMILAFPGHRGFGAGPTGKETAMPRGKARPKSVAEKPFQLVLSCEHATPHVPREWSQLFEGEEKTLLSHRGWDPGTLELGRFLAGELGVLLSAGRVSRLLVELNRSLHHRQLFSRFCDPLSASAKSRLIRKYWSPYREEVCGRIESAVAAGKRVLHVSLHSFTAVLHGEVRTADLGLLYDPRRQLEAQISRSWQRLFREADPGLKVRRNYPYRGISDGLTTALRGRFPDAVYAGLELEMNQRIPEAGGAAWSDLRRQVGETLASLLGRPS